MKGVAQVDGGVKTSWELSLKSVSAAAAAAAAAAVTTSVVVLCRCGIVG
mgnify:CR=1 FL=1